MLRSHSVLHIEEERNSNEIIETDKTSPAIYPYFETVKVNVLLNSIKYACDVFIQTCIICFELKRWII